jgi:hypothetical protein
MFAWLYNEFARTYIDESAYIYAYTLKYAGQNKYLDEYACMYAYIGEYILL